MGRYVKIVDRVKSTRRDLEGEERTRSHIEI